MTMSTRPHVTAPPARAASMAPQARAVMGDPGLQRPGVMGLLALIFICAGLARLGTGAAAALDAADSSAGTEATIAQSADPAPTEDPMELFPALRAREARLIEAESALEARRAALAAAEAELARQLENLTEIEARLSQTLALSDEAAERDLARLTAVFENMKPREAAALFEEMDVDFAAGFIARLRPESAADVLAGLSPRRAYAVSAVLAGRNADVPRD